MRKCLSKGIVFAFAAVLALVFIPAAGQASDDQGEFPQKNVWFQATPSVVWNNDPESTTTLEAHIVGRKDVKRVWLTYLGSDGPKGEKELFDDGTHGDKVSGDNIFTLADVMLTGIIPGTDYNTLHSSLRVELDNGALLVSNNGVMIGLVDSKFKGAFPVQDFGNGLSATPYAFFIQDSGHEVINSYPVSDIYCGRKNFEAYKKFFSVFPDEFDFASLMPGMQIFRPKDLAENVPYDVAVSNSIRNIGRSIMDNTKKFGSAGRLKSVVYNSFGCIQVADHELGHTWGVTVGKKLGLISSRDLYVELGHWNDMADVQGQMGAYYNNGDIIGHFAYNGDGTWRLISNLTVEPYSPLELYLMGLIPSSDVPDVHILKDPDLTDPEHITAKSYKTITAEQIVESAGGERIPSSADSQKEFNMAFIVTQDLPYNDAAYAYFSLLSKELMTHEPPRKYSQLAPFYWATGGRATLNTYLGDYGVLDLPAPTPAPTIAETPTAEPSPVVTPTSKPVVSPTPEPTVIPVQGTGNLSMPVMVIIVVLAALVIAIVVIIIVLVSRKKGI